MGLAVAIPDRADGVLFSFTEMLRKNCAAVNMKLPIIAWSLPPSLKDSKP